MKLKQSQPSPHPPTGQMIFGEWRDGESGPIEMVRGGAVVDGNVAYFMHGGQMVRHVPITQQPRGGVSSLSVHVDTAV